TEPVSISTKAMCGAEERYETVASGEATAGEWLELRGTFTAPLCDDLQEFVMYIEGPAAGVDLYLDDVIVAHSSVDIDELLNPGAELDGGVASDAGIALDASSTGDASLDAGVSDADADDGGRATTADAGAPEAGSATDADASM